MTETKTKIRLTAEQLDIPQEEYDALIWVRDALDPTIPDHDLPAWMRFDMVHWGHVPEHVIQTPAATLAPLQSDMSNFGCGTACCIGGSMQMHIAGLTKYKVGETVGRGAVERFSAIDLASTEGALNDLFFVFPNNATREQAVEAIDRVLIDGQTEDPWNRHVGLD